MTDPSIYTRDELAALREAAKEGTPPVCPRCGIELISIPVPRPAEVSYVRSRVWYLCASCSRSAVLDR